MAGAASACVLVFVALPLFTGGLSSETDQQWSVDVGDEHPAPFQLSPFVAELNHRAMSLDRKTFGQASYQLFTLITLHGRLEL